MIHTDHRIRWESLASLLILAVLLMAGPVPVQAAPAKPYFTEYSVEGSPYYLASEAPGRVWFTLPEQNAIGRLVLGPGGSSTVDKFTIPTANSRPYDISFAAGAVWFTEEAGNKIGRLDPGTGQIAEYSIPTPGSRPHGIYVRPGSPTYVWFAESDGNAIGRMVYSGGTGTFAEYAVPWASSHPEDVYATGAGQVWFTAPDAMQGTTKAPRIALLQVGATPSFFGQLTGANGRPWRIKVDEQGTPWFTDRNLNRIGQYFPSTLTLILYYYPPTAGSQPDDIIVNERYMIAAERGAGRLLQVDRAVKSVQAYKEFPVPTGEPVGLADEGNGCFWAAESATNRLAHWCPPYFEHISLPLIVTRKAGP